MPITSMTTQPTTDDVIIDPTNINATQANTGDSDIDPDTITKEPSQKQTSQNKQTWTHSSTDTKQDNKDTQDPNTHETIAHLEKKLSESQEIAKKAQYDYINAKMDLDRLQRRLSQQESEGKVTQLIEVVKKLIPAFEDLRNSVDHIPADQADTPLAKGINIVYTNITKTLNGIGITAISSLWMDPDSELHEPMGLQPAPSEDQKGKIISEFSRAYLYEKNDKRIVVQSAKVIIGE